MIRRKTLWRVFAVALTGVLVWTIWPLYGFVSNQFETARLPWGWHSLPLEAPTDLFLSNPAYADAADAGMKLLETRRNEIGAPSLSAAIAINGELIWAGATGWGNVEHQEPATVKTVYRIGSTSKAVGITGLARLVADDKVELDQPISLLSGDLPNKAWGRLTPRQLASHTSGIAAYEENNDWPGFYHSLALTKRFNDPRDALSVFDGADLLFNPTEDFHYSGFNNVLLSTIMQDAAGQPFDDVMSEYVFRPLGINTILPDHLRAQSLPFAVSYQTKGDKVKPWRQVDLSHKLAAGGYVSTPSDLAVLGAAWLDNAFIPKDIVEEFWTPVHLSGGDVNVQDYALGFRRKSWPIKGVGDVIHLNHGGISKGAQCWLMIVPEHNLSLAISVNRRTDEFFDFADVYVDILEVFIAASSET